MDPADDTATPPGPYHGICLGSYFDVYVVAGQRRERLYPHRTDGNSTTRPTLSPRS
jgi:hypothetical protein